MEHIKDILKNLKVDSRQIRRFKYEPYSLDVAAQTWLKIAEQIIGGKAEVTADVYKLWCQLIYYVHGDDRFQFNLEKAIGIIGKTGTGKSLAMQVMNIYSEIDSVKYLRGAKVIKFQYKIASSRQIVSEFASNGYAAIDRYCTIANLCIDDLGAEEKETKYYGTNLKVMCEIIEERYRRGLMTHFTANLTEIQIEDRYDDRVYSRLRHTVNFITLNTKDFRCNHT